MILLIQALDLFLDLFLHVSSLQSVDEGRAEVEPAQRPWISDFLFLELLLLADSLEHLYLLLANLVLGMRQQSAQNCLSFRNCFFNLPDSLYLLTRICLKVETRWVSFYQCLKGTNALDERVVYQILFL